MTLKDLLKKTYHNAKVHIVATYSTCSIEKQHSVTGERVSPQQALSSPAVQPLLDKEIDFISPALVYDMRSDTYATSLNIFVLDE